MITFKDDVRFVSYSGAIRHILNSLYLFQILGPWPEGIMVTSVADGKHLPNSRHYKGEAIDLRSKNFTATTKLQFQREFENYLNKQGVTSYSILLEDLGTENEHFHVQVSYGTKFNG